MSGTVLVTGAGGFIGRHVCRLLDEKGWNVRAAVRSHEPPTSVASARLAGTEDAAELSDLLHGCEAVVHMAARVHVLRETAPDPAAELHASNTVLTGTLARAAAAAGVRTFVLMSSIAAVSNARSQFISDEVTDAPDTAYGASKLEAENVLVRAARGTPLRAVALRPPMVYGEGMRGNPLRLFGHLARGLPLPVVRPPVTRSMMYVGNLAEAVLLALTCPALHGRFCVTDGTTTTIDWFAVAAGAALRRPVRLLPVPAWTLRAAGAAGDIVGRALPVPFDGVTAARLTQSLEVDGSRFARVTEFTPRFPLRDALHRTAAWFLQDRRASSDAPHAGVIRGDLLPKRRA